jgi:peptidoglycan/LPS O-acetylase OafA/YrhL
VGENGVKHRIFAALSRVTSGGRYVAEIDGLRFAAVAPVVLYHLAGWVGTRWADATRLPPGATPAGPFEVGHYGVELFFAISGFVLATPFAQHWLRGGPKVGLRRYFLRRLTRLEPPYIINLLIYFVGWVAIGKATVTGLLPSLLASLGYQHNAIFDTPSRVNGVAWSLEVEIQFYALVPLLTAVFRIRHRSIRRTLILLSIPLLVALQQRVFPYSDKHGLHLLQYLHYFMVGFFLADLFVDDWAGAPTRRFAFDVAGLLAWFALPWVLPSDVLRPYLFPGLMVVAYVAAFRGPLLGWLFTRPLLTTIGGMCYTIYLYHFFIIALVGRIVPAPPPGWGFGAKFGLAAAANLPPVLVVCALLFVLIERPCMIPTWPSRAVAWLRRPRRP